MIILDNGHGHNTPGKRSPDGLFLEWEYTRLIARQVYQALTSHGIKTTLLVPESQDVPLSERVARANRLCITHGASNCRLVSIHVNAAGMGDHWHNARGWSVFVAQNASTQSIAMAQALCKEAEKAGLEVRRPQPRQDYWVQSLAMCRDTRCPAVLTENLFMDNRNDYKFLLSPDGIDAITNLHIKALIQ